MRLAESVLRLSILRRLFYTSSVVIKVPRLSLQLTRVTVDGTLHRFHGVILMIAFKGPTPPVALRMLLTLMKRKKKKKRCKSPMMIMPPSDSHGTCSIALVPFLASRCQRGRSVLLGLLSGICMVWAQAYAFIIPLLLVFPLI